MFSGSEDCQVDTRRLLLQIAEAGEVRPFHRVEDSYTSREKYYNTMQPNVVAEFSNAFVESRPSLRLKVRRIFYDTQNGKQLTVGAVVDGDAEKKADMLSVIESLTDNIIQWGSSGGVAWVKAAEVIPSEQESRIAATLKIISYNLESLDDGMDVEVIMFAGDYSHRVRACIEQLSADADSLESAVLNPRRAIAGTYTYNRIVRDSNPQFPANMSQKDAVMNLRDRIEVIHGPPGTGKSTTIYHILNTHLPMAEVRKRGELYRSPAAAIITCVTNQAIDSVMQKLESAHGIGAGSVRSLVLGNANRIGKNAARFTLENLCQRDEVVVVTKRIQHFFSTSVRGLQNILNVRGDKILHGRKFTATRLKKSQIQRSFPRLWERTLRQFLIEIKCPRNSLLKHDLSSLDVAALWAHFEAIAKVNGKRDSMVSDLFRKLRAAHVEAVERVRQAMVRVAVRVQWRGRKNPVSKVLDAFSACSSELQRYVTKAVDTAEARTVRQTQAFICTIPSSHRVEALRKDYKEDFPPRMFLAILDEAGATAETYVPQLLQLGVENLVLLGDHKQLPPLVISRRPDEPREKKVNRSLMERVLECGTSAHFLKEQYRMPKELCKLVSRMFYGKKLVTGRKPGVDDLMHEFERLSISLPPMCWVDVSNDSEMKIGTSFCNPDEAARIVAFLQQERQRLSAAIKIITFYKPQVELLNAAISRFVPSMQIDVVTVDACQGTEGPHILLSAVRSNQWRKIGFVSDPRRLCVAISRAQRSLAIFGDARVFSCDRHWREVVNGMPRTKYAPTQEVNDFCRGHAEKMERCRGGGKARGGKGSGKARGGKGGGKARGGKGWKGRGASHFHSFV